MNLSEELVGDGGFDEEEENQIQIYWRAGNTMVSMIMMMTLVTSMTIMTDSDLLEGWQHHGDYNYDGDIGDILVITVIA